MFCPVASVSEVHRQAIRDARGEDTRLTRVYSGRPARARKNDYSEAIASERLPLPEFPTLYALSSPLTKASSDSLDYRFLLYGQAAALNQELPVAELMESLVSQATELL